MVKSGKVEGNGGHRDRGGYSCKVVQEGFAAKAEAESSGLTDAEAHRYAGSVQAGWEGRAIPGTRRSKC